MKKSILTVMVIIAMLVSGCAGICNPNAVGVAAGFGMQRGVAGIPGIALAGGQLAACGAYLGVQKLMEKPKPAE